MVKTMTSTRSDQPREVWLSGTERIRLVHELVGIERDDQIRGCGRTTRMAVRYAFVALQAPDHKVLIEDHFDSPSAHRRLLNMVEQILTTLHVEYDMGTDRQHAKDEIWIRVRPINLPTSKF